MATSVCRRSSKGKFIITLPTLLLAAAGPAALSGCHGGSAEHPPGPETQAIALVAGHPVSPEEFNARYELRKPRLVLADGSVPEVAVAFTKVRIADELVDEALILAEAERRGWSISDADLDEAMQALTASYSTREAFDAFAARFPAGVAGVRAWLRVRRAADAMAGATLPDDAAVAAHYDEHRGAYVTPEMASYAEIVLGPSGAVAASPELQARAANILALARDGAHDFHGLAQLYSVGPTAAAGGLRRDSAETAGPAKWKVLSGLQAGGVSDLTSLPDGDVILRLEARAPARSRTLAEASDEIRALLTASRRSVALKELRAKLRASESIEEPLKARYADVLARATVPVPNRGAILGSGSAPLTHRVGEPSMMPAAGQGDGP